MNIFRHSIQWCLSVPCVVALSETAASAADAFVGERSSQAIESSAGRIGFAIVFAAVFCKAIDLWMANNREAADLNQRLSRFKPLSEASEDIQRINI